MGFFEKFFGNIGKKMKAFARWMFVIESILMILLGLVFFIQAIDSFMGGIYVVLGLLFIFLGPLLAWLSSWVLYGFGELIDKTCDIEKNTRALGTAANNSYNASTNINANGTTTSGYNTNPNVNSNIGYNTNTGHNNLEYNVNIGYNAANTAYKVNTSQQASASDPMLERNAKIESLRARGLISEEEYQRAMSQNW